MGHGTWSMEAGEEPGRGDRVKPEEAERGTGGSPRKPFFFHLDLVGPRSPPRSLSESAPVKAELSGRGGSGAGSSAGVPLGSLPEGCRLVESPRGCSAGAAVGPAGGSPAPPRGTTPEEIGT